MASCAAFPLVTPERVPHLSNVAITLHAPVIRAGSTGINGHYRYWQSIRIVERLENSKE